MAEVVELKHGPGNGARDALIGLLKEHDTFTDAPAAADIIIGDLWVRGFKIIPTEEKDEDPWHIPTMQLNHFKSWVGRKVWAIVDLPNGQFQTYMQSHDGVAPPSEYPTLRKAAARLLQLLATGPVAPQTWPEDVCVGHVQTRDDEAS
jgi:hypothetical protein